MNTKRGETKTEILTNDELYLAELKGTPTQPLNQTQQKILNELRRRNAKTTRDKTRKKPYTEHKTKPA